MTENYHTPISEGAAANAATFNSPLGEMDEALTEALLLERDGHIIQEEGSDLPQKPRLDFAGAGVTVTDEIGKTLVTIPGSTAVLESVVAGTNVTVDDTDPANPIISASGGGGLPPGYLFGLTLANNGTDPTNDIDIATGKCRDSTDAVDMALASALTKRLDAAWAVGTNQGGLDTGSIANTTYHVWLIKRSDTGVVDVLFSTSASAPTMPTSYDYKRRIGSIVRTGGAIKGFVQDGDNFQWLVPVSDYSATNPGTSAITRTITVPTGIRVKALLSVLIYGNSAASSPQGFYVSDLSVTNSTPSTSIFSAHLYSELSGWTQIGATCDVYTDTSAQIRVRVQVSTATTTVMVNTNGWIDTRGK